MHLELTPAEITALSWLLNDYVRDTRVIFNLDPEPAPEGSEEMPNTYRMGCGECGELANPGEAVEHTPGCAAAPIWALYDKVERLEADIEMAALGQESTEG